MRTDTGRNVAERQLGPKGLLVGAAVFIVIAVLLTGIPMLAIANGHPLRPNAQNPNDIGRYFLVSVACVVVALWLAVKAALLRWRSRKN